MTWFVVDVEADGPIPGEYSMTEIGAAALDKNGNIITYYNALRPMRNKWVQKALDSIGKTRQQTIDEGKDVVYVMEDFEKWVLSNTSGRPIFVSDNNGFDWMFVCYYFWVLLERNPFGFSSRNIGDLYKGIVKDTWKNFKHLRKTKHDHKPDNDAKGNLESLIFMRDKMGLKISL